MKYKLRNDRVVEIRELVNSDSKKLFEYFDQHFSKESKSRFGPHSFDRQTLDAICKNPIIELVPRYEEYCTMNEACLRLNLDQTFAQFTKMGLFQDRNNVESKMYEHQFKSLEAAIGKRKHIVATTGTGSGKTECFLFPMLYDIYKEKIRLQRV